ncbi:MAG: hypothetical protein IMZ62_13520 [Chloroflexi bacterium]|nr:hypothetical protein [Chloroflexota bacterium]
MAGNVVVTVVKDRTISILAEYADAVQTAIGKAVLDIEGKAKENVTTHDAIDTGALRASIYSSSGGKSNFSSNMSEAHAAALTVGKHSGRRNWGFALAEQPEVPTKKLEGITGVGAEYGANIEYGGMAKNPKQQKSTIVPARPFLQPAADEVLAAFDQVVANYINKELT